MIKSIFILFCLFLSLIGYCDDDSKQIVIAKNKASSYVIYYDKEAPCTVKKAAEELQRVILKATGVKINISNTPAVPMICLGNNQAARKAGISTAELLAEGFLIKTVGNDIFIVGNDTLDNEKTKGGGTDTGTLYGCYEFLERFLDVRWLMPGEAGEDVPERNLLSMPAVSIEDSPDFQYRDLRYIRLERDIIKAWAEKQKVICGFYPFKGSSLYIDHNHMWEKLVPKEVLLAHPEYMALVNGKRTLPEPVSGNIYTFKFCTSNPELVKEFAKGVREYFEKNPDKNMLAISPTDDKGFCECENCKSMDENSDWVGLTKTLYGKDKVSITKRILTFYCQVAKSVREKYPDKTLCGYIYDQYAYPPNEKMSIESNLLLMIAPRAHYSFSLYRKELMDESEKLIKKWAELYPGQLGYYNLPTKFVDLKTISAPQPIGISILKRIFPLLKQNNGNYTGVLFYGGEAWGTFGPSNYILAKLMWRADADIDNLFNEWFDRAYGKDAAEPMKKLYKLLDEEIARYKINSNGWDIYSWQLDNKLIVQVYQKIFPEMEKLYLEALSKPQTAEQKKRLLMFGDNMIVLHWNLQKGNRLKNPEDSCFFRSDKAFLDFAKDNYQSMALMYNFRKPSVEDFMRPKLSIAKEIRELGIPLLPESAESPVINAEKQDGGWQHYGKNIVNFYHRKTAELVKKDITGKVIYDKNNLYISLTIPLNNPEALKSHCNKNNDDLIYQDDCIEILLGLPPSNENIYSKYWHITVNANGAIWVALSDQLKDCSRIKTSVKKQSSALQMQIAIPFDFIKSGIDARDTIKSNICISIKNEGIQASWNPVPDGFCEQEYFGTWRFRK